MAILYVLYGVPVRAFSSHLAFSLTGVAPVINCMLFTDQKQAQSWKNNTVVSLPKEPYYVVKSDPISDYTVSEEEHKYVELAKSGMLQTDLALQVQEALSQKKKEAEKLRATAVEWANDIAAKQQQAKKRKQARRKKLLKSEKLKNGKNHKIHSKLPARWAKAKTKRKSGRK